MTAERILAGLGVIGLGLLGVPLTFFPAWVVHWQARWYKFLWEQVLKVEEADIPARQRAFILKGIETPDKCAFNITSYRFVGTFLLLAAIAGLLVVLLSSAS